MTMTKIFALFFTALLFGCSSTVVSTGLSQAGAGGSTATGGAASVTGGAGGNLLSTAGASGNAGSSAGGSASTGGSGGAPAGSTPVNVVPGVATDCVFPSYLVLPPVDLSAACSLVPTCATSCNTQSCVLPITLTNLSWDYSTSTLTFDVSGSAQFFTGGSCMGGRNCGVHAAQSVSVTFTKTDRGYQAMQIERVYIDCGSGDGSAVSCVTDSWTNYWKSVTIPCAQ
jgi:hypothetical protein